MYSLASIRQPKNKKQKLEQLVPVLYGLFYPRKGADVATEIKILLDSGASSSIMSAKMAKKLRKITTKTQKWETRAGIFTTNAKAKLQCSLPELDGDKTITYNVHIDASEAEQRYDLIMGRDLLAELRLLLDFGGHVMKAETGPYAGCSAPMKSIDDVINFENADIIDDLYESERVRDSMDRVNRIQAANYHKADLKKVCDECEHLERDDRLKLYKLLKRYEFLFDGTLGTWRTAPVDLELKPGAKPYHAKPYPVPRVHEKVFRDEVERLCKIGVLRKVNDSKWGAPTFIQPKKNKTVRFLSDFRELNKLIKRKPFPIPKIQDMLQKLEGFTYATSLDLNMGYYHIRLTPEASRLCTIVLPWGKYSYNSLPMGVCNSPDIFQEKISELFQGFEYVRAYIDDVLLVSSSDWNDHLQKLDKVLAKLGEAGLKVNADKSFFGRHECEYLGFWVTRDGVRPLAKKVEAINNIKPPKNQKEVRRFVGLINYYRDMWPRRAHILAPLTRLTSKKVKFHWGEAEQKAFEDMKTIVGRDTLLAYPNFDEEFVIHTDASKYALGGVISQKGMPIAFYSQKLTDAQTRYTTTERELLAIVEILKEFRTILLGQRIKIYTDHKNLTFKIFNTDRVIRWRLLIEEYGPRLIYIKGPDNDVADALSRLNISNMFPEEDITTEVLAERYGIEKLEPDTFPLTYATIRKYQLADAELMKKLQNETYDVHTFRGGGKPVELVVKDLKIVIPKSLQSYVLNWYHTYLLHPGATRTEETIKQHLYWKNLQDDVKKHVKTCATCQKCKKQKIKYGHLPAKEAEATPWERLCVDLIGPYKIKREGKEPLSLKAVTMIDPATGWFEIVQYDDKKSITVANLVEQTWLT